MLTTAGDVDETDVDEACPGVRYLIASWRCQDWAREGAIIGG
jgi:hypothetical protein